MADVRFYKSGPDAGEIARTMVGHPDNPYEP
jgi:hypothetical protein